MNVHAAPRLSELPNHVWSDWFIVRAMVDELLVYDLRTQKVTSLNGIAAKVWQAWEAGADAAWIGSKLDRQGTPVDDLGTVDLALTLLRNANLIPALPPPSQSFMRWKDRRAFLGKFFASGASATAAAATTALTAPSVVTILAPTPAEAASGCTTSAQCVSPTPVCSGGHCVAGCTSDGNCPIGSYCNLQAGNCQQGCDNSSRCPVQTPVCLTNTKTCVVCATNTECGGSTPICVSNSCAGCTSDAQCGNGKYCQGGSCLNGCTSNSNCVPPNGKCNTATHSCVNCLSNSDCANPTPICQSTGCAVCTSNSQCPLGYQCNGGSCVVPSGGCTSNSQCNSVDRFCAVSTGECVECLVNNNCEDPFFPYCVNNECE